MLEFKHLELKDKLWIAPILEAEDTPSADYSFGNIYTWNSTFRQSVSPIGDRLAVKLCYRKKPFFAFPVGSGDLNAPIEALKDYADAHSFPFTMMGVTIEQKKLLEEAFPDKFSFDTNRDLFDYVYSAEKLATLSGKKLHAKRNHINRFIESNPNWTFEPLHSKMAGECLEMLDLWTVDTGGEEDHSLESEHEAIERSLENMSFLNMEGGVLRVDGKMVGFTIGEKISSDTFDVHFEKAYHELQGAYPMINREFVRQTLDRHPEIKYINREDDMGHENLRKAKLSYRPEYLLEKYSAHWEE